MLRNARRAITAAWVFQLNANVTCSFCWSSVDLVEFWIKSVPCRNNVLCLSLIPKATENEKIYQITYDDLRGAAILLCSVQPCRDCNCKCCSKISELFANPAVVEFIGSDEFPRSQLSVQTAMCDNFKGCQWCKFAKIYLGVAASLCKQHATGNVALSSTTNATLPQQQRLGLSPTPGIRYRIFLRISTIFFR